MKEFSSFNITAPPRGFEGDKIKMSKILNRKIIIHDYKIEDSKCFKDRGNGKCLHIQISINETKHIIFTSANALIETIQQVSKDDFPFQTTIIQENDRYIFS
jgi:hypothetical protein